MNIRDINNSVIEINGNGLPNLREIKLNFRKLETKDPINYYVMFATIIEVVVKLD